MEKALGLECFLTESEGIDGKLKAEIRDFIVKERSFELPESENGKYCVLRVKATNWETNSLISLIAKKLRISKNHVHIAGIKDKRAITEQLMVVKTEKEKIEDLKIKDAEISFLYPTDKRLYLGNLYGNDFEVRVRECRNVDNVEFIKGELTEKGGFPNYFGVQRFGVVRPNTHRIGKLIVEENYKNAVMTYLCEIDPFEGEEVASARKFLKESGDFKEGIKIFPRHLEFERNLMAHLIEKPGDYAGALRNLPYSLKTIFVYAHQSYLFNRVLSRRMINDLPLNKPLLGDIVVPLDRHKNPENERVKVKDYNLEKIERNIEKGRCAITGAVFGYATPIAEGAQGQIEREVLEEESCDVNQFHIYGLPELSAAGLRRPLQVKTDIEHGTEDESTVLFRFSLPKGCYATSLMREFMKSGDIRCYS
jgi:tRNA pseudouridine13 synthase